MILESMLVGPIMSNCFIVGDEKTAEGAIIDPGAEPEKILQKAGETGLNIQCIIATHGHFDHTAAVQKVKGALGCPFLLHRDDLFFVKDSKEAARRWGFEIDQVPDPDRFMEEGEFIRLGELELEVLYTPGHSPGGISLYVAKENVLFAGDTLFYRSIGRTDLRQGSMEDLTRSIQEKLYSLPDDTVVYTGHGRPTTIGEEKTENMFVTGTSI